MTAARTKVNLGGRDGSALTYGGEFPGPTFVVRSGDTPSIAVTNGLTEETTVHWHGLVVPTDVDGQPHNAFGPGETFPYKLPIIQRASLNFYHPHAHQLTASQVALGLQGAFIIRDTEEDRLNLPSVDYEVPLVIRDANVDRSGRLTYNGRASGFLGSVPLVNGTLDPYLEVARSFYRFRAVNAANSRVFRLALSDGRNMTLIGNDGGLLPSAVELTEITFGNAERLDLLMDFRNLASEIALVDLDSGWTLLRLRPTNKPVSPFNGLTTTELSTIVALPSAPLTRTFSFDGMTAINGVRYSMGTNSFDVLQGQVEKWRFIANGNPPHPVHIHGASFQIVERRGGRAEVFDWERGWKDTFLLLDKESVDILIRFDLAGRYLIHCHKLEHEDAGMMLEFTVTPDGTSTQMVTGAATTTATTGHDAHHG
jgi:FtsP/CotA-like multicopper oxidase with cupredoxin domain